MPFDSWIIIFHCIDTTHFFFHLWSDVHLGCFHFVTIKKYCYELIFQKFCERMFSFLLDICLQVELLNRVVILFNFLRTKLAVLYNIPTNNFWGFHFLYILTSACYFIILVIAFLVHLKCYIIVIMVCIFLMTKWCWASLHMLIGHILVYPLWRNVYPLPIFKMGCLFIEL